MKGVSVALVVQKVGPNLAIDYGPRSCREANIVQIENQAVKPALATGTDQVAIFSTVSAKDVSPSFLHVAAPIVSWDTDLLDLAANGKREDVVFVEATKGRCFWIVDALQPLAAGESAGIVNVYVELAPMSWGMAGLGAITTSTDSARRQRSSVTRERRRWPMCCSPEIAA